MVSGKVRKADNAYQVTFKIERAQGSGNPKSLHILAEPEGAMNRKMV